MIQCGLETIWGSKVFVIPMTQFLPKDAERITGCTVLKGIACWGFPAFHPFFEDVLRDLEIVVPDLQFNQAAQAYIAQMKAQTSFIRPDYKFVTQPFDHQREALEFLVKNPRAGLLYDPGLGKTKVAIDLIRHEFQPGVKTLILSPVVTLKMWQKEFGVHDDGMLKVAALLASSKAKKKAIIEAAKDADVLLVSYDSASHYYDDLCTHFPFSILVADESQAMRSVKSTRTKCALALAARAARRIIMSGTPSLGDPNHLYGQLSFLGKFIPAPNWHKFRTRHMVLSPYNDKVVIGFKNLELLNRKVQKVAIRKTKEECLDLPERMVIDVPYELSSVQLTAYNKMVETFEMQLKTGELYEVSHAAVALQKLLQILSGFMIAPPPPVCDGCKNVSVCAVQETKPFTRGCPLYPTPLPSKIERIEPNGKLEAFTELFDTIAENPTNKLIVWCHFTEELNIVENFLKERQLGYIRIDGSNSSKAQTLVDQFSTDPNTRVWLGQIATGVGITLNAATYTIYFGLNYSLDAYLQSIDRNYRIGQKQKTTVYRLIAEGSVLEYVAKALEAKVDLANTLTSRVTCVTCQQAVICLMKGIQPFKEGCKFKDKAARVVTKMKTIRGK